MKNLLILIFSCLSIFSCKKEKTSNNDLDIPNPMVDKKGWNLVKHSTEFFYLKSPDIEIPITLDLVQEHPDGIDILYNSIFNFQFDVRAINTRWRAYHNKDNDVIKVVINERVNQDFLGRPIFSSLVTAYSTGMGNSDLYAITQIDKRANTSTDGPYYQYDYFNVKTFKENINSTWFKFKSTQVQNGIASANPKLPFVCNGMNARVFNNTKNIYFIDGFINIIAAAPKGNQLVMLAIKDSLLYVLESTNKIFMHSSGSYGEEVNAVIIKNVYNLYEITNNKDQNFIDINKYFYNDQNLFVFLGLRNQKHRLLKIDLNNYTLKSEHESLYEQMDLNPGFKNVLMLNDRPGEMLSMEKDGIYHISKSTKTFIPSPSLKLGTSGTTAYYSNGKIWQILFDEKGAYLINKTL